MTTFTENLNNAKPAQDKYFFEGGGARKASNALLAALMLGFSPAIAADNSVAVTNSSPLAGEARWGVNSNETLTPSPSPRGRGEISTLTSELTAQGGDDLLALEDTTLTFPDPMGDGAVSFTPVTEKDDNTISQFQYNQATGGFEPVFYRVDVKTEYGTGDTALNFGWEEGADGNPTFTQNPTAPIAPEIIYKYDSSAPVNEALEVTTDISDTPITGNFINLDKSNLNNRIYIHDGGKVSDLNGNFINIDIDNGRNWSNAEGEIGNLNGNFIYSPIVNWNGTIKKIKGNFIGSETSAIRSYSEYAGNEIGSIVGNFIGNRHGWDGGAIYNGNRSEVKSTIGSISGNFINNYVFNDSDDGSALGGAIYNTGNIGKESNQIRDNAASQLNTAVQYNSQTLINSETGESFTAYIAVNSENMPLTAEQLGEYLASGGKVIRYAMTGTVDSAQFEESKELLEEDISGGYASTTPADIPAGNILTTDDIIANLASEAPIHDSLFIGNHVKSVSGGAAGGAIYNDGLIGYKVTGEIDDEQNNPYVDIDFDKIVEEVQSIPSIQNSSFYNNYAEIESGEAFAAVGGAIYSSTDITIAADDGESIFSGNKVINNGVEESNAIFMGTNETYEYDSELRADVYTKHASTLTLDARNNGLVYFDDKIDGLTTTTGQYYGQENPETGENEKIWLEKKENDRYNVELTGDGTGKIVLNNDVLNADLRMNEGANVYLGREDVLDTNNVTLNGGSLFLLNNKAGTANFDTLSISADTDLMVDVDLANSTMDRVSADSYGELNGNINVVGMNLLSDAQGDNTEILFADNELKNNVTFNGAAELSDSGFQTTAYTPIYKYNVAYGVKDDGGYFTFNRLGGSSGGSDAFNPAVLGSPVASQAANQSALNEVFHYSYEHVDSFTKLPAFERYAKINANKYAMSTDFNDNMPSYAEQLYNKGVWFKPFTTFESLPLKNGPKVDAITYGSLVGFDTDFKELGNGWHSVFSGFAGYVGSSLNYSGVDSTMNGGLLGFTETFYKGNFWTAVSATAGASVGETHNMYGKEDYTSLLAGVGSKTGYNFEFKEGRFIIQPIMYLGYTFVNTFDYKNSAGVNIESDPLHTIQINPSVRFIANLKGGWQPYASVGMVWNLMNETKATANNVRLPEMSVKPYVEYGVGVQRNWADKFTAFLQAMIRNGGRNGVSLTGGFRFMLGSDDDDSPKVKKEIKSL